MLVIHQVQLIRRLLRLPLAMLIGLGLMAAGGALDFIVHFGPVAGHETGGIGWEQLAHLAGITGMFLVLAGVVARGVRTQRRPGGPPHGGLERHAPR